MLGVPRLCLISAAVVLGAVSGCVTHRTEDAPLPDPGMRTPEILGVLRPGDPYGGADEGVPGRRVGVALGDSAARCRPILVEVMTDTAGRFHLPSVPRSIAAVLIASSSAQMMPR